MLVDRGADVPPHLKNGPTSLHLELENRSVDLAGILVDRGADESAQMKDGSTALHLAPRNGYVGLAGMLVERCADVSARPKTGGLRCIWHLRMAMWASNACRV